MTHSVATIVGVMVVLQVKHFICDYPLQTRYHLANKGTYGHPGGLLHSGIHVLGTLFVFLIVTPSLLVGALILAGEFLIHYHLDWGKGRILKHTGWTQEKSRFWWAIGADQLGHHLTYAAIVGILLSTAGTAA